MRPDHPRWVHGNVRTLRSRLRGSRELLLPLLDRRDEDLGTPARTALAHVDAALAALDALQDALGDPPVEVL